MAHKSNFFLFFLQWADLIGPSQNKVETVKAPQNRRFSGKMGYLFCFILISWRWLTSPILFFLFFFWLNKVETMEAPQIIEFYGKMECLPLWPTYIGEKGRTLGKKMGLKWGPIRNTLGEHIGNLMVTWRERVGNKGNMKKILLPPPQNLKEKKSRHFECMLSLPIGCMKFLLPKLFITIFGLD